MHCVVRQPVCRRRMTPAVAKPACGLVCLGVEVRISAVVNMICCLDDVPLFYFNSFLENTDIDLSTNYTGIMQLLTAYLGPYDVLN